MLTVPAYNHVDRTADCAAVPHPCTILHWDKLYRVVFSNTSFRGLCHSSETACMCT